tara:strand:+ start:564 stop:785 length:222 start_codon:yes stop_codon:yes gene_type:complete
MLQALHSLLVYEEIVANTTLRMMTKLTDAIQPANRYWDNDEKRSEAFRKAFIVATEATLIERKESKLFPLSFD